MLKLYFCRSYHVEHLLLIKITQRLDEEKSGCYFVFIAFPVL